MLCRILLFSALLTPVLLTGCENSVKELSKTPWIAETAKWPELEALQSGEGGGLQRAFIRAGSSQMPAPEWFNDAKFVESLQKFEATPIPSKFATPEREELKKEMVALIKKLQGARGLSKETSKQVRRLKYVFEMILFIPGQVAPTGSEAAKYSIVIPPIEPVAPVEVDGKKA